jgi:hypothetical protein
MWRCELSKSGADDELPAPQGGVDARPHTDRFARAAPSFSADFLFPCFQRNKRQEKLRWPAGACLRQLARSGKGFPRPGDGVPLTQMISIAYCSTLANPKHGSAGSRQYPPASCCSCLAGGDGAEFGNV